MDTIGHGTLPAEELATLLDGGQIRGVIDVRSFPGSRHNPQFGRRGDGAVAPTRIRDLQPCRVD
ncbi:hypothetical protein [Iamia sp.]|uniref:hypothetical protein n=1 Tax=Iamia sp. TaxID=2722710 RepID=UPI002CC71665|nr:hypothetical protein [Iamia sp.]HXH58168.1 hypothetical protein [Iamia sp.]